MPSSHLALLRGVNVGGKNILPMKDLAALFAKAGCSSVRTFIQSGNVIFTAAPKLAQSVSADVAAEIEVRFGFRSPVIVRTAKQLREAIAGNPFPGMEERLHVMFLRDRPHQKHVSTLDSDRSAPDRFIVRNAEVYLHLPNGVGKTKLTNAWFDTKLSTVGTLRNWRTVTKLLELMDE